MRLHFRFWFYLPTHHSDSLAQSWFHSQSVVGTRFGRPRSASTAIRSVYADPRLGFTGLRYGGAGDLLASGVSPPIRVLFCTSIMQSCLHATRFKSLQDFATRRPDKHTCPASNSTASWTTLQRRLGTHSCSFLSYPGWMTSKHHLEPSISQ